MYIKIINNLKKEQGEVTTYMYGGLDINKLNSSVIDEKTNVAVAIYNGTELNQNVLEITEAQYNNFVSEVKDTQNTKQMTTDSRLANIELALANMMGV
jgi:hypothetical protein